MLTSGGRNIYVCVCVRACACVCVCVSALRQEYYGVMSDMSSDMMLKVAVETCEMEERWEAEQWRQAGLLRPLHVWIGGWVNTNHTTGRACDRPSRAVLQICLF